MTEALAQRIERIRRRAADAARRAGRSPGEVTLIAVSKTFGPDAVQAVLAAGVSDFGENRAQELKEKAAVVPGAVWHFVGPLQTNKVRHVVGVADLIHSVDRLGLAEAIGRRAGAGGTTQGVLIEVNLAGEPSKHGVAPPQAPYLARSVAGMEGVHVRGLMAIPPRADSADEARGWFRELVALRDRILNDVPSCIALSMGMSSDFEVAIEEGATFVRVGEAIFGPRTPGRGDLRIS